MESLTSPKIIVGVHCLKLRTKGMYITAVVDPAEADVLRSVTTDRLLVRRDADRLRARPRAVRADPAAADRGAAAIQH